MDGSQLKRIEGLKQAVNILAGLNNENAELCATVSTAVADLKLGINEMRNVLEEQNTFIEKMKNLDGMLDYYNEYLDYVEENFPDLPEQMENLYLEDVSPYKQEQPRNEPAMIKQQEALKVSTVSQNGAVKKPTSGFTEIRHITVQELNSVHGYMRGRLTAESINMFVDVMNLVLKKKYDVLKQPRNRLRNFDSDLYDKWKIAERKAALGPGSYFCSGEDFVKLQNFKLDKSAFSKIVILRHLKLLKEVRRGNETFYVLC